MDKDPEDQVDDEEATDAPDSEGADDADADDSADDSADDDAGSDDDSSGDGSSASGKADSGEDSGSQPSRKSNRVAALAAERNRLREELAAAKAVAEERSRQTAAPANSEAARREREERLALMDPQERKEFLQQERIDQMQNQVLLTQLRTEDLMDKNNYEMRAAGDKVYARHAAEVERRLQAERQAGRNWPRATLLAQIVGEHALKAKPDTREKERARERVESSRGKPVKGRSNATTYRPSRGNETFEELESRIANVSF